MPAKLNFFRKLQEGQRIDHTSAIVLARVRTQTAGQKIRRHQLSLQLPNISGKIGNLGLNFSQTTNEGALWGAKGDWWGGSNDDNYKTTLNLDASRSSTVYGRSTTVQPPSLRLLPCIKV